MSSTETFEILRVLAAHGVDFVVTLREIERQGNAGSK